MALSCGGGTLVGTGTWNQPLWHGHFHGLDLWLLENDIVAAFGMATGACGARRRHARPADRLRRRCTA